MAIEKTCRSLDEDEKIEVKKWLLKPTFLFGKCPFASYDHSLCKSWFPKITKKSCPCDKYSFAHIVATAMRMMES